MALSQRPILALAAAAFVGCQSAVPPPRVHVPLEPHNGSTKTYPQLRPLAEAGDAGAAGAAGAEAALLPPPAFDDVPLVTQAVPEQPAYLDAYARVGKPRVAVFVNRTIEGQIIPADARRDVAGVEVTRASDAAVDIQSNRTGPYGEDRSSTFKTDGPARVTETATLYLSPAEYDAANARAIDYEAIELALAEVLSAGGKVTLVSPTMARQRLSDEQVKDLQAGRPSVLREVAEQLDADILIQVQARPTKQAGGGTGDGAGDRAGVRVLVEAINTRGGESVARSFVDVPPPLDKPTINRHARFVARKTMHALTGSWTNMADDPPRDPTPREPTTREATTRPREDGSPMTPISPMEN